MWRVLATCKRHVYRQEHLLIRCPIGSSWYHGKIHGSLKNLYGSMRTLINLMRQIFWQKTVRKLNQLRAGRGLPARTSACQEYVGKLGAAILV